MDNLVLLSLKKEFDRRIHEEGVQRIIKVLSLLSEEEVWYRPNKASNSVGILSLHLCGNVTQWIGAGLGQNPDIRVRDLEFAPERLLGKKELEEKLLSLEVITNTAFSKLKDDNQLLQSRSVQGFNETVLSIIVHVIEHFSYHVGQIALIAKYLKGKDLGFYADLDLNAKG